MSDSATPWTAARQTPLSFTISWSLLKLMSIESVMPSNHHIPCCPLSSHLQSFPASGSFKMSQFFTSGGQSFGASASASVLPVNIQDWFPWGLTGLISLLSRGLARVLLQTFVNKVMTLDFNTLSRFVIVFLPKSRCLLISWLKSSSTVILELNEIVCCCFHFFPHLFAMKWWDWMS